MRQRPNFEIVVLFMCLAFWYFAMAILRALIYVIPILVVRMGLWMLRSKALDAAEEWIKATLLYLSICFLAAIREYVLDMCFSWLELFYKTFLAIWNSLYLHVFGPQVRRRRPRPRY